MSEEVYRADPAEFGDVIAEGWLRMPSHHLRAVEVASSRGLGQPFDWLVTIAAREYFRDDPLGLELQQRLESAMLAVPGVTGTQNTNWETWVVTGEASGEALCRACATVLDELADRMHAAYEDDSY